MTKFSIYLNLISSRWLSYRIQIYKYTHHHNLYQILVLSLIGIDIQIRQRQRIQMQTTENNSQLTAEQYQMVLKYMETTNEQNFEQAIQMLKVHQFKLQNAVSTKLGLFQTTHHNTNRHHGREQHFDNFTEPRRTNDQNQNMKKYIQYLRDKQNKSIIYGIFSFTKNLLFGIISGITELILPEFILQKIMRSRFYNLYRAHIPLISFKDRKLSSLLQSSNSYLARKPIMFVISAPNTIHKCYLNIFNQPAVSRKINQMFIFAGAISEEKQCDQLYKLQNDANRTETVKHNPPQIIICRKNVFEKIQIVKKFTGEEVIQNIDVHKLNYVLRDHQRSTRKDRNLLVKYRNHIRRNYYGNRPGFYQQQEQEEQLYQNFSYEGSHTQTIHKQNEEYKKMQEQTRRKESLQILQQEKKKAELKKLQQKQQQRKVRKMSIPEQPQFDQGKEVIRFNFRCPQGQTVTRNFSGDQKLDLIYHWIQTNEEIQFQDNVRRQFQLLYGFPPTSLSSRKDQLLKHIFDSNQEKLMIRQL